MEFKKTSESNFSMENCTENCVDDCRFSKIQDNEIILDEDDVRVHCYHPNIIEQGNVGGKCITHSCRRRDMYKEARIPPWCPKLAEKNNQ